MLVKEWGLISAASEVFSEIFSKWNVFMMRSWRKQFSSSRHREEPHKRLPTTNCKWKNVQIYISRSCITFLLWWVWLISDLIMLLSYFSVWTEALEKQRQMYERQMQLLRSQLTSPITPSMPYAFDPFAKIVTPTGSVPPTLHPKYQQWERDRYDQ